MKTRDRKFKASNRNSEMEDYQQEAQEAQEMSDVMDDDRQPASLQANNVKPASQGAVTLETLAAKIDRLSELVGYLEKKVDQLKDQGRGQGFNKNNFDRNRDFGKRPQNGFRPQGGMYQKHSKRPFHPNYSNQNKNFQGRYNGDRQSQRRGGGDNAGNF